MLRAFNARSRWGSDNDSKATVPFIFNGLLLRAVSVKLSKRAILFSTGMGSSENLSGVPSMVMSTEVLSKSMNPLKTGFDISPVISISPLSIPWRRAVPGGRNGLATANGNRIILKSSMNGFAAVESLRLPFAVMAFTPFTLSVVLALIVPDVLVLTLRSRPKSPTRSLPYVRFASVTVPRPLRSGFSHPRRMSADRSPVMAGAKGLMASQSDSFMSLSCRIMSS